MDPQHNSAHSNPARLHSEPHPPSRATSHHLLCHVHEEVVAFNHTYNAPILERQVQERFPPEESNEAPSLEKELYISELAAVKKEAFETLLTRNAPHLRSLGLSLALLSNTTPTAHFTYDEASFHLDNGERFIDLLASYVGNPINENNLIALVTIFEDLLSYLQYHGDLTDPEDTGSIEFAASLQGVIGVLKKIPEFQHAATVSILARYTSFLDRRCLHEVIMVERASIFEVGSLRLNDSGTEFIHIPFSNPSLRWHIICNNSENYARVWETCLNVLDMLISRPAMKQLSELAVTTTLRNLHWIKQDLSSNGWSLRDDGESEEFKIVVDETADKLTEMLQSIQ